MKKHLYFICPTDHLETVINNTFKQENYFCTSLGNSIIFDTDTMGHINALIEIKNITEITFVLSDNNRIFMDALMSQNYSDIEELNSFYNEIIRQQEHSKVLWQLSDFRVPILSHHLKMKIKELQPKISSWIIDKININGKIHSKKKKIFEEIHSNLFQEKHFNLN